MGKSYWQMNMATCPGMCSHPQEVQRAGVAYLTCVTLAGLFMVITAVMVVSDNDHNNDETAALYGIVSIYCSLVFVYLSFDSIISENRFQFWASLLTATTYTVLVGYKAFSGPESLGNFWLKWRFVIFGVKAGMNVVYCVLFPFTLRTFGFYEYKVASADPHIQKLYGNFRVFLSILKVDLFFVILLLMLGSFFLFKGTRESTVVVDAVALGASLLWSFVGWYSAVKEHRGWNTVFLILSVIEPAYVAYSITNNVDHPDALASQQVTLTQYCIIAGAALAVRVAFFYIAWRVRSGFGEGLYEKVFHRIRHARKANVLLHP